MQRRGGKARAPRQPRATVAVVRLAHEPSATSATACGLFQMMMTGGAQQSPATLMESSRKREILRPSRGVAAKHTPRGSLEPH